MQVQAIAESKKEIRAALVGLPLKRREDKILISGRGKYVDDIKIPGMLHASVLRSAYAHAKIKKIDFANVLSNPDVVLALSGEDIRKVTDPLPVVALPPDAKRTDVYMLAVDKVHYSGEPVAVVVAKDRYSAEDAIENIEVEYEPLEPVIDVEKAVELGAPRIYPDWEDNVGIFVPIKAGNVEAAFKNADHIIKEKISRHRLSPSPIETRGYIASYEPMTGKLLYYASTQMPHVFRSLLSKSIGIAESKIQVIAPQVGGAFGQKAPIYQEEPLIAFLSIKLQRPVKWIETRSENLSSGSQARQQVHYIEFAVKKDGKVTGIRDKLLADMGAYLPQPGPGSIFATASLIPSGYKIENYEADVYMVHTNKAPYGAYRGYGKADSNFVMEIMLDSIATKLKIDPVELRLKNFIPQNEFPYTSCTGKVYDSGNYAGNVLKAIKEIGYHDFRIQQKDLRKRGIYKGISVSFLLEPSATAVPDSLLSSYESATVRIDPSGKVTVLCGTASQGQGHETVLAQVTADELGVPIDDIEVLEGDTSLSPYGLGAWSSRFSVVGVGAVILACRKIKNKLLEIASLALSSLKEDLTFDSGDSIVSVRDGTSITIDEIARIAYTQVYLLEDKVEPCLEETARYVIPKSGYPTWGAGAYAVIVDVDIETGKFSIEKQIVVSDSGRVLNPLTLDGQIIGGMAQGIGGAIFEDVVYDSQGSLLSSTFVDYLIPTALEIPTDVTVYHMGSATDSVIGGAKGAGEGGAIFPAYGLTNAVIDALSDFRVERISQPLSPENVWKAISKKSMSG